jgi:DNA-binding SARP family transcriptional activator/ABC-type transport system substrate-binding protein
LAAGRLVVDFRILGPLEVVDGDKVIPLGGAKQRAALAILLLHPNQVVSRDRLIEGLWGEWPPATADHTLDTYMSRLRRALGDGDGPRVVSRRPGYSLRVEAGELDLERFELLLEEGRHDLRAGKSREAADILRQALGLVRGPPLDDLAHTSFAQNEAGRLDELPLAALEERIEADLALARHDEILPELQGLVVKHPFRERFWAGLMLTLYRSGRQAEALDAFEHARQLLADELGVDPGPSLQRVHEDILRHAPPLHGPVLSRVASSPVDDVGSGEGSSGSRAIDTIAATGSRPEASRDLSPAGPDGSDPKDRRGLTSRLPQLSWVTAVVATLLVLALIASMVAVISWGRGATEPAAIEPGVTLLDAKNGAVVAQFPSIVALEIWYADGTFWVLKGTPDGKSISFLGIDARSHRIVTEFPTGLDDVGDFAVHGDDLWVSDYTNPTLVRMNIPSGRIEESIPLATNSSDTAGSMQVATGGGSVWVARPDAGEIVRLDADTGQIQRRYSDPAPGCCLAFGGRKLWFEREDGVTWLDARTGEVGPLVQVIGSIAVGGGFAWSANMETGTAHKISDAGNVVATYPTGEGAERISYDDGSAWVANGDAGTVTAIDTVTGARRSYAVGGHLIGSIAAGAGLVAVTVRSQERYDDTIAGLEGNVARILLPAYFTITQEPALTDIETNPLMVQIEEATCAKLLNYSDSAVRGGWQLQPEIAISMPAISPDGRTYTFTVGPGYRFSPPSNEPVTAEVLRYSIERALSPGLGSGAPGPSVIADIAGEGGFRAGTSDHISGLRAVGDRLMVTLKRPSADFLERLALPYFCPVPIGTPIVKKGVQDVAPPSAGPYYMALPRDTGELMILKRNPNYAGPRPHEFDAFAIREGIDPGEAIGRVEQGTWDAVAEVNKWVTNVPPVEDPLFAPSGELERSWPASSAGPGDGPAYQTTPLPLVDYLAFNASRPLFSRRQIRSAVASVLDRSALATSRGEAPSDRLLPSAMAGAPGAQDASSDVADLRHARALVGGGRHVAVMAIPVACEQCLQVAQAVRAQLHPIGIEIRITEMHDVSAPALSHADVDLVERVTSLPFPDSASFLAKMLGGDVPVTWLPTHVRSSVERVAALDGPRRSRAATRLAVTIARAETPVASFADGSIGELFSTRMGCIKPLPFGAGVDLAALCLK